jgi:flagellar assembly factor FliW
MNIQTKYFGVQEIDRAELITFSSGLPGFPDDRRFILQPFGESFSILQSADHANVAFIVTSPFLFFEDYSVDLPEHLISRLAIASEKDVSIQVIVNVRRPFVQSTANLKAPVVINRVKKTGAQYIADQSPYSLREPLVSAAEQRA